MTYQIQLLARLADVDSQLDDYEEDLGDLPVVIRKITSQFNKQQAVVDETKNIIDEVRRFEVASKKTLAEHKEREETLTAQQFTVRNNKEFDAITKEIEHLRSERSRLLDELRTVGVKEENLKKTYESQKNNLEEFRAKLEEKQAELDVISGDQNDEVKVLKNKRDTIQLELDQSVIEQYERIRTLIKDAVVKVRKNSCSGCFSTIPQQKIVILRNNLDKVFTCENCGRIIYPEDMEF